ncbi:MAG: carboxypeptidase regulatory-like domain-containing protein [Candidatus Aminicenantes bacterium]|nr:MAG: carboxypeptidase regulatory-like domain-containing protein [Candidatus Aminicenantes bacterium]
MAKLKGFITHAAAPHAPIGGAAVSVYEGEELKGQDTTSANDGYYEISLLNIGTIYTLKVSLDGEEKYSEEIEITQQSQQNDISIELPVTTTTTTTSTTSSTTTTGTTTTMSTTTVAPVKDDFEELLDTIEPIGLDAPVSIEEARQLRRLYTIGNYLLAKVPQSIPLLKDDLGNNGPITGVLYDDVSAEDHTAISDIIDDMSNKNRNEDLSMEKVLNDLREQCDLGTSAVEEANVQFKSIFKEFVSLCTDELLAVKPADFEINPLYWDAKKQEELHKYWKKLIRVIIKLTRNMSVAGSMSPKERVLGWADIIDKSVGVLFKVGKLVHAPDQDEKHGWSVVAKLNDVQKSDIKGYLVHAKEGGYMLQYAIKMYEQLEKDRKEKNINVEDDVGYINELLHDPDKFKIDEKTASEALRAISTTVLENWHPDWA